LEKAIITKDTNNTKSQNSKQNTNTQMAKTQAKFGKFVVRGFVWYFV